MASWRISRTSLALATVIAMIGVAPPLACSRAGNSAAKAQARKAVAQNLPRHPVSNTPQIKQVVDSALEQIGQTFDYDPSYSKLDYPNGDLPLDRGVCADVVVRAFRKAGVDLQKEV